MLWNTTGVLLRNKGIREKMRVEASSGWNEVRAGNIYRQTGVTIHVRALE